MKRGLRGLILGLLSVCLLAFTYYVDVEGGEADLSGHLQSALDAWKALDETLSFEELNEAATSEAIISYGNEALFGPDLYTLTLQTAGDTRQTQVLIKPSARDNQRVLRHEVGVLLGLSTTQAGIMNPAIRADDAIELVEADANQLEATVNAAKEDLNRDGKVDFYDLAEFSKLYGSNDISSSADINEDGVVDNADLELLRTAYTFSEPSETAPADPNTPTNFEEVPPVSDPTTSEDGTSDPDADTADPDAPNPETDNPEGSSDTPPENTDSTTGDSDQEENLDTPPDDAPPDENQDRDSPTDQENPANP